MEKLILIKLAFAAGVAATLNSAVGGNSSNAIADNGTKHTVTIRKKDSTRQVVKQFVFYGSAVHQQVARITSGTSILLSKEYALFNQLKDQSELLEMDARSGFDRADDLHAGALRKLQHANDLRELMMDACSAQKQNELFTLCERYREEATAMDEESQLTREIARDAMASSYQKRVEAELYIQSQGDAFYSKVLALGDQLSGRNGPQVADK